MDAFVSLFAYRMAALLAVALHLVVWIAFAIQRNIVVEMCMCEAREVKWAICLPGGE